jgi:hypothetical protein
VAPSRSVRPSVQCLRVCAHSHEMSPALASIALPQRLCTRPLIFVSRALRISTRLASVPSASPSYRAARVACVRACRCNRAGAAGQQQRRHAWGGTHGAACSMHGQQSTHRAEQRVLVGAKRRQHLPMGAQRGVTGERASVRRRSQRFWMPRRRAVPAHRLADVGQVVVRDILPLRVKTPRRSGPARCRRSLCWPRSGSSQTGQAPRPASRRVACCVGEGQQAG